eukprot:Em0022g605a
MGQTSCNNHRSDNPTSCKFESLPDLANLPPELAVQVLSHLDATDLCLAACVNELWSDLANVDQLWKGLCQNRWGDVSSYQTAFSLCRSYKTLYMILDNGMLTFAANPHEGIAYLVSKGVLTNSPRCVAMFIHNTDALDWHSLGVFLRDRIDVLEALVSLQDYSGKFLPDALREFFSHIPAPRERGQFLETLLDRFSKRYVETNPQAGLLKDTVYVICYSLILLSVDLTSPHVKNKMSKREFIRNLRRATPGLSDDLLGHMYDNIYISGHVATEYR